MDQVSLPKPYEDSVSASDEDFAQLERILHYKFKSKNLLTEALTHSSMNLGYSYERLAFMGDSLLSYLMTNHLHCTYPHLDPGTLSLLHSRNVENDKLARVSVKHKFHQYLRLNEPNLRQLIQDFVEVMEVESTSFICGDFNPPKVLADIVESIAAAVFIDSGRSADQVWEVFRPLLEPLISLETLELHPVTELYQLCQKQAKHIEYKSSMEGDTIRVTAVIDGNVVGSAEHPKKVLAKRVAAREALGKLRMKYKVEKGSSDENQNASHEQPLFGQANLNNFCMKRHWPSPDYKLVREGPPNKKQFVYSVRVNTITTGWTRYFNGHPRPRVKMAKDSAAKAILDFLENRFFSSKEFPIIIS